jgi:hypothetical protein
MVSKLLLRPRSQLQTITTLTPASALHRRYAPLQQHRQREKDVKKISRYHQTTSLFSLSTSLLSPPPHHGCKVVTQHHPYRLGVLPIEGLPTPTAPGLAAGMSPTRSVPSFDSKIRITSACTLRWTSLLSSVPSSPTVSGANVGIRRSNSGAGKLE